MTQLEQAIAERDRLNIVIDYLEAHQNGSKPKPQRKPRRGKMTAGDAAAVVLGREAPMRTPHLLAAVQAEGATIKNSDSLYRAMLRDDRFERAGRGLWTLAKPKGEEVIFHQPDPPPNTGNRPITYVAYSYVTPAETKRVPHERIPGFWFRCHVPVHGKRVCVLFRK